VVSNREDNITGHKSPAPKIVEQESESDDDEALIIPREKVEEWVTQHNRSAASLLAAFRASKDTNFLNEAAANFPNDPQVEWTVLARNAFPEERRKWLDLLKTSSPSNSVANYLSAEDYFKSGQTNEAIAELLAAASKSQFNGFSMESLLDNEHLNQFAGKSAVESAVLAMSDLSDDYLGSLSPYKRLALSMQDLAKANLAAGDSNSAQNLAQAGLTMADQLRGNESGKLIITKFVGNAVEAITLSQLDQNTSYDFLSGQTPSQKLQQLKNQRAALKELQQNFNEAFPYITEEEYVNYSARMKIYGEEQAMRWIIQQHSSTIP
jgi:hypothetical protein